MTPSGRTQRTVAVVGCGHWGANHVRVFDTLPGCRVGWAVDPDEIRRQRAAAAVRGLRTSERLHDALDDPEVDAVVVAAPAAQHHGIALAALRAGKHVLCEKPLALAAAECAELVETAAAAGVVLMVGHVFLFNPAVVRLKEMVDAGELGRLWYATAVRSNLGPVREDVNAVFDLAAHEVAIFNHLLESVPATVSATGRACLRPDVEDVAFLTLVYPDGTMAAVTVSWLHPRKVRTLSMVGEKRMVVFDDLAATPLTVHVAGGLVEPYYESFGEFQRAAQSGEVRIPAVSAEEPLRRQARAFLDSLERGTAGVASGVEGWDVVRVLEAAGRSLRQGGVPTAVAPRSTSSEAGHPKHG
jgi:predicted dehydrogenase